MSNDKKLMASRGCERGADVRVASSFVNIGSHPVYKDNI